MNHLLKEIRMNIYVGNLASEANDDDLKKAFEAFGQVASATVITDKYNNESKGFGFVEMPSGTEAQSAIEGLNGQDLKGKTLNVNEARPRTDNRGGRGNKGKGHGGGRSF
jgi:RNA recognition motif-containing protein